jgi:hypothetical protein
MMGREFFDFEDYRLEKLQNRVNRQDSKKNKSQKTHDENIENRSSEKEKPLSVLRTLDDLKGEIYYLGNILYEIPKDKGIRHPGAVIELRYVYARVSKGTDEKNITKVYYRKLYIEISPDEGNGLKKPTLFSRKLHEVNLRSFYNDDRIGKLSDYDYQKFIV